MDKNKKIDVYSFPTKPIGGKNPYHMCASCEVSVPEINGRIHKHRDGCAWRKEVERVQKETLEYHWSHATDQERLELLERTNPKTGSFD